MKNHKIDTILYDLGGVLIDWNPRYLYTKLFDNEADMEYFLEHITTFDWNERQDEGHSIKEATEWLVNQHPDHEYNIRAYYGRWTEMLNGEIPESVKILEKLKSNGRHRLYALTNWSGELFPYARKTFRCLSLFEDILVSGDEKLKKPDPQIFTLTLSKFGIDTDRVLFIDDNIRNVEAARDLGILTHHFQSPVLLEEYLVEIGLL